MEVLRARVMRLRTIQRLTVHPFIFIVGCSPGDDAEIKDITLSHPLQPHRLLLIRGASIGGSAHEAVYSRRCSDGRSPRCLYRRQTRRRSRRYFRRLARALVGTVDSSNPSDGEEEIE